MEHLNEILIRSEIDYRTERARQTWQPVVVRRGRGPLRRRLAKGLGR